MSPDPPLPPLYKVLRRCWSVLHVGFVIALTIALIGWWTSGSNGPDLLEDWWGRIIDVQSSIARSVPFPWDA